MKFPIGTVKKPVFAGMLAFCALSGVGLTSPVFAQFNPALREDAEIERQKLLRAADQLELLISKVEQLQAETASLREQVSVLQEENKKLAGQLDASEKQRSKEKQALLDEVAKLVSKGSSSPASSLSSAVPVAAPGNQEGYEHKVQHGETLWSILQAYREQTGTKANLDDICAASNISKNAPLRTGQILFIPKK